MHPLLDSCIQHPIHPCTYPSIYQGIYPGIYPCTRHGLTKVQLEIAGLIDRQSQLAVALFIAHPLQHFGGYLWQ
ncbi:MAG: hypothetical protein ACJAWL_002815 [Motiliproteus sp.]|jgi:hypothetical protein